MEKIMSQWCFEQRDKCLSEGKFSDAENYLKLAHLWQERESKEGSK